jgi:hypothetical protein
MALFPQGAVLRALRAESASCSFKFLKNAPFSLGLKYFEKILDL